MPRLIVVPQYPTRFRYQEWYPDRMREYRKYFDEVIFLEPLVESDFAPEGTFASFERAIKYELAQIEVFLSLEIKVDDVLLLCDLSYPGLFASVLYHKRPDRCFALCHGTSINKYDYFEKDRISKWSIETGHSKIFNSIFVATEYHRKKLGWGWPNCHVVRFPLPRVRELSSGFSYTFARRSCRPPFQVVSVARPSRQKVDMTVESSVEEALGHPIIRFSETKGRTWSDYYGFLRDADFLLVSSREETYGYQVIDALSVGTVPIAPKALSYPELLPDCCLYAPGNAYEAVWKMGRRPACPGLWEDTFIADTAGIMLS